MKKSIKKILYATDFSENTVPAAEYALTLAQLAGADIHVVHVLAELVDHRKSMLQPESYAILEREVEVLAIKEMTEFCRVRFGDQVHYTTEVVIGRPFQAILERAAALGCDLIVLGTHGRSGMENVILGSTAQRIVRRSTIPVLTVRGNH